MVKEKLRMRGRPEMERRSSTLDSLSDEGEDEGEDEGDKNGEDGFATDGDSERDGDCEDVGAGSMKEGVGLLPESTKDTGTIQPSASLPLHTTISSTSAASSSRERSPPPSYDYAILPSALHQSSLPSPANNLAQNEDAEPMSARRRGKQRDMQDTEREDGAGGRRVERGEGVMLELLANSDTSEGEEVFPENTARSSLPTGESTTRERPNATAR
ncbi:hypothetical protein QFC20_005859 [Naganishia adeliensis]|uniref:Uncharacterized protein n=1 Tax=Naganishia adeliensis TaxID=92952 RepID=A0ACC2VJX5_9TREE|nr:hypothetical protein QFC20_005859 [Naganishia adeliensis]